MPSTGMPVKLDNFGILMIPYSATLCVIVCHCVIRHTFWHTLVILYHSQQVSDIMSAAKSPDIGPPRFYCPLFVRVQS